VELALLIDKLLFTCHEYRKCSSQTFVTDNFKWFRISWNKFNCILL